MYEYSFCLPLSKNVRVLSLNEDLGHACSVHSQGIHCPFIVNLVEIFSQFVKHVGISSNWKIKIGAERHQFENDLKRVGFLRSEHVCGRCMLFQEELLPPQPESNVLDGGQRGQQGKV